MKDKKVHFDKGRILSVQGKYEEAIEEYRKALEIDPNYRQARTNLELIYYMKGMSRLKDGLRRKS